MTAMRAMIFFVLIFIFIGIAGFFYKSKNVAQYYGAPPLIEDDSAVVQSMGRFGDLSNWERPEGPLRVGLQAGHWKNEELPDELDSLRGTSLGTSRGAVTEWEVNLKIAQATKVKLESQGLVVDILPATIPPAYYADVIIAIHADGSTDPATAGFKVSAPRRNLSGKSDELVKIIEESYQKHTNFEIDPNISRNMIGYYAFNWRRYEHSTHPMAPSVILETGFLTNLAESKILINNPELPATAIAEAVVTFLNV